MSDILDIPVISNEFFSAHNSDAFKQSVRTVFGLDDFKASDFVDINAQNSQGMTVLHLAAVLNDSNLVNRLLTNGANPAISDQSARTPLKIAALLKSEAIVKLFVGHALSDKEVLKMSEMTLYKNKGQGVTGGGFYHDNAKNAWLVKEGHGHGDDLKGIVNEYVASGIFKQLLGDYAPQNELVYEDSKAELRLGSKLIEGFKTLDTYFPYGEAIQMSFDGKPIKGLMDVVSAIVFLNDTDGHRQNIGIVEHDDMLHFAKVDHGFSMDFWMENQSINLGDIRFELSNNYSINQIESLGFFEVYNAIKSLAEKPFEVFENIISEKVAIAKEAMAILQISDFTQSFSWRESSESNETIEQYSEKLNIALKSRHESFQNIADTMLLEKSVLFHNYEQVVDLIDNGFDLEKPFIPFFGCPSYENSYYSYCSQTTGRMYAEKYWPELESLLNQDEDRMILAMNDVLSNDTVSDFAVIDLPTPPVMADMIPALDQHVFEFVHF
jgi:hypothetical protein